jgi:hypothetical protein
LKENISEKKCIRKKKCKLNAKTVYEYKKTLMIRILQKKKHSQKYTLVEAEFTV